MLSMIGQKNSQLYGFLGSAFRPRRKADDHPPRIGTGAIPNCARIARRRRPTPCRHQIESGDARRLRGRAAAGGPGGIGAPAALAEQALEQVRAVSHSLHPPEWQDLTIGDALRELVHSSGLTTRLEVEFEIEPLPGGAAASRQNRALPVRPGMPLQCGAALRRHLYSCRSRSAGRG